MENYEELEGKEIKYKGCDEYTGLVVGCDLDIGITIVEKDNNENFLFCLNGPSSSVKYTITELEKEIYPEEFEFVANMLRNGVYNSSDYSDWLRSHDINNGFGTASLEMCSFGQ